VSKPTHFSTKDFDSLFEPTRMFQFSRLVPIVRVTLCIVLVLEAALIALGLIWEYAPHHLPTRRAGPGYLEEIHSRIDTAQLQIRDGTVSADEPLCIVTGLSGAQEGIAVGQLTEEDGIDARYLGLCGANDNATMLAMTALVEPLFASELRPALTIVAISPLHVVDPPPAPSLGRHDVRRAFVVALMQARRELLHLLGVTVDPRHRDADPWRDMKKDSVGQLSKAEFAARLAFYEQRGYFDASRYQHDGTQTVALRRLVERLRALGTDVVIVLLPVHSSLVEKLPPPATESFEELLHSQESESVPVLDFQQAISDDGFWDPLHLNLAGREEFTRELAKKIGEQFDAR
jgi:hypothetical protein